MFPPFHPLLLHCAGNFAKHKSILWKLHLKSHHLPPLTGLYSTLNGNKYFIVTCTVIDTQLWLCLDKIFMKCLIPDWVFNILQIHSLFSEVAGETVCYCSLTATNRNWMFLTSPIFMSLLSSHADVFSTIYTLQRFCVKNVALAIGTHMQIAHNMPRWALVFQEARKVLWQCGHLFICLYGLDCVL